MAQYTNPGTAYAFFKCDAKTSEIEAELPTIREFSNTDNNLELKLIEGVDNLKGDSRLAALAKEAKDAGNTHVIEAKYPGMPNKAAASELAGFMNVLYPDFYEKGEKLSGDIIYDEDGEYIFCE